MSDSIHCELYGHIVPSLINAFVVTLPANMNSGPDLEPTLQSVPAQSEHDRRMIAIGLVFLRMLCHFFKPQQRLEAKILVLWQQLSVLQQRAPRRRLRLHWADRSLFI
jgi:hypothetical protein